MENLLNDLTGLLTQLAVNYGLKLLGAVVILIIGWNLIGVFSRYFGRMLTKSSMDESLKPFLRSLVVNLFKVLLVISVLGMMGVEMTSVIAIIGAAGLAVGLALSGTLQNFAGGVMILIFRPFKVGDFIEAQGFAGTVREIQIFNTILKTPDNRTIIIPNGGLSTGSLVNFSTEELRRVDWTFGIAYGDDADNARRVLLNLLTADTRILDEPEPFVALRELADSSVDFTVRGWVKKEDYWAVFFDMNRKVYQSFPKNGLNIPFPQMDVHLHQQDQN